MRLDKIHLSDHGKNLPLYDFGVLSMQTESENLHYLHDDLGSPIRLIDDHGHENSFSYDEFGGINQLPKSVILPIQ